MLREVQNDDDSATAIDAGHRPDGVPQSNVVLRYLETAAEAESLLMRDYRAWPMLPIFGHITDSS
jgi:hypothetical protein